MLAGYLSGHFKWLSEGSSEVLSRFVFNIALPSLVFAKLSHVSVSEFFNWPFIGALGGGMLVVMLLAFVAARLFFGHALSTAGLHSLTAMFSSTAYIGLPIVLLMFGDAALASGILGAVITGVVFMPIAILLIEFGNNGASRQPVLKVLTQALCRPPIIATVAGLLVSVSGVMVPAPVITFFETLGGAFIPCALFAAGLFLPGKSLRGASMEISWLVVLKLLVHPLITFFLAVYVFDLNGVLLMVAVIQAALPSGVPVFVLAQQYQIFVMRSSAVIVLSTLLSLGTLTALLLLIQNSIVFQ